MSRLGSALASAALDAWAHDQELHPQHDGHGGAQGTKQLQETEGNMQGRPHRRHSTTGYRQKG
jgi:hypothetical protein